MYVRLLDEPSRGIFADVPIKILERTARMHHLPFDITSSVADIILDLEEHFDQCRCEDHESTVPTQWPELVQCNNIDATLAHLDLVV